MKERKEDKKKELLKIWEDFLEISDYRKKYGEDNYIKHLSAIRNLHLYARTPGLQGDNELSILRIFDLSWKQAKEEWNKKKYIQGEEATNILNKIDKFKHFLIETHNKDQETRETILRGLQASIKGDDKDARAIGNEAEKKHAETIKMRNKTEEIERDLLTALDKAKDNLPEDQEPPQEIVREYFKSYLQGLKDNGFLIVMLLFSDYIDKAFYSDVEKTIRAYQEKMIEDRMSGRTKPILPLLLQWGQVDKLRKYRNLITAKRRNPDITIRELIEHYGSAKEKRFLIEFNKLPRGEKKIPRADLESLKDKYQKKITRAETILKFVEFGAFPKMTEE